MLALYNELIERISKNHSKMKAIETVNHLFSFPFTTPTEFAGALDVHPQTASTHLAEMKQAGILSDLWMGKNHLYYYRKLYSMIKS